MPSYTFAARVLVVALAVITMGCERRPQGECRDSSQCDAGYTCADAKCRKLCLTQGDCDSASVCLEGLCTGRAGGAAPEISAVVGNDITDAARIIDGVVVSGGLLGEASFELRDGALVTPLVVRNQSEAQAEVLLPVEVRAGAYALAATNRSGTALAEVTLQLPDLSGDVLVERLNTQATTKLTYAALPSELAVLSRGTVLTDVARGSHVVASTATDLHGIGPTSELTANHYWSTRESNGWITIDLGQQREGIFEVVFESQPRGSTENLPVWEGAYAYTLEYGDDGVSFPGVVPAVAPLQGDVFVHRLAAPVAARYFRLTVKAPNTPGGETRVSLFRALTYAPGEATAIAGERLYHGGGMVGEPWHSVTLGNGWTEAWGAVAYYKDPLGIVRLRGGLGHTAADSSVMFTLPPGYRPSQDHVTTTTAGVGPDCSWQVGLVSVRTNGDVSTWASGQKICWYFLNGTSFRAEQ